MRRERLLCWRGYSRLNSAFGARFSRTARHADAGARYLPAWHGSASALFAPVEPSATLQVASGSLNRLHPSSAAKSLASTGFEIPKNYAQEILWSARKGASDRSGVLAVLEPRAEILRKMLDSCTLLTRPSKAWRTKYAQRMLCLWNLVTRMAHYVADREGKFALSEDARRTDYFPAAALCLCCV